MSNYNIKELKWPSRLLKSDNFQIHYNDSDVLMMITRYSKSKEWRLTQYPIYKNNEFVRGLNSVLNNQITGEIYARVDGVVTKFENNIAYRAYQLGVSVEHLTSWMPI